MNTLELQSLSARKERKKTVQQFQDPQQDYTGTLKTQAAFEGTEEQKLAKFREVRDQIQEHVKRLP